MCVCVGHWRKKLQIVQSMHSSWKILNTRAVIKK